jgi:DNA-binding SARP family transcriptional activator
MPALRIQTLGPFRLWRKGELIPADAWPTYKSQLLFKILLTERGHFVPADRLMEYLWPDLSPKQAQNNLWVTISQARRMLQPELPPRTASAYIVTHREGYAFNQDSDYWLDVDAFTAQLSAARQVEAGPARLKELESAKQLYHGDYLEDVPYEEWALTPREQLRGVYLDLLADLAELYARIGRYRRAISLCHESLAIDSLHEATYRRLMLFHYGVGEQNLALKVYEECARVMQNEIGVEPAAETVALYNQIQHRQVEGIDQDLVYPVPVNDIALPYSLSRTSFVGRGQEYNQLVALATQARAGQGQVILIEGEPGVGKSRLVQEAVGFVRRLGMNALLTNCYQIEQSIPFYPIIELLDQVIAEWPAETLQQLSPGHLTELAALLPELTDLVPDLPPIPPQPDETRQVRLFKALIQLLTAITDRAGLVLIGEDIHWADYASLQCFHDWVQHLSHMPILMIFTYRGEEVAAEEDQTTFIHSLKRQPHVLSMKLTRLSLEDVQTLLANLIDVSTQATDLSQWLYRETEGNPFFLVSILQSILEQGLLTRTEEGAWQIEPHHLDPTDLGLTLPEALREAIRSRLRRVPPRGRHILEIASVLGRHFDFDTLRAVSQEDQLVLLDGIEVLIQRRLLYQEQDVLSYDFNHEKIREVVYHDLSAPRRQFLHQQIAETLEAQPGRHLGETASILAHHFERAGQRKWALEFWLRAGEHALTSYALQSAVRHYERALALAEQPMEEVAAYYGLGRAHFALDDNEAALADLMGGLQLAEGSNEYRPRMLYLLADIQFARYEVEACESLVQLALAAAESSGDQETRCQSLSLLGQVHSARGELEIELELITQALNLCRQTNNRWREGRTLADLGWIQAQRAEFDAAIVSAEQALVILETTADQAGVAFAWNILGRGQGGRGEYDSATASFLRSREIAEAIDHKFLVVQVPNMLGWLHQQLCDYQRALEFDQEGVEAARRWSKTPAEISALINVALDICHLGNPGQALTDLEEIRNRIVQQAFGFHAWRWRLRLLHATGLCHLALGEASKAHELAEMGMSLARETTSQKYVALNHELSGAALADGGQVVEAIHRLETAVTLADDFSYQPLRWQGRHRLTRLYELSGRNDAALTAIIEAQQIIEIIAAGLTDELQRAAFLRAEPVQAIAETRSKLVD